MEISRLSQLPSIANSSRNHDFVPETFSNPISFKLDEENFCPWKHQALATIKAHKLQKHLDKTKILKKFLTEADDQTGNES